MRKQLLAAAAGWGGDDEDGTVLTLSTTGSESVCPMMCDYCLLQLQQQWQRRCYMGESEKLDMEVGSESGWWLWCDLGESKDMASPAENDLWCRMRGKSAVVEGSCLLVKPRSLWE